MEFSINYNCHKWLLETLQLHATFVKFSTPNCPTLSSPNLVPTQSISLSAVLHIQTKFFLLSNHICILIVGGRVQIRTKLWFWNLELSVLQIMFGRIKIIGYWAQKDFKQKSFDRMLHFSWVFQEKMPLLQTLQTERPMINKTMVSMGWGLFFCKPAVFTPPWSGHLLISKSFCLWYTVPSCFYVCWTLDDLTIA